MDAEQRILIIGDALQSTSMTDRIFREALPAECTITSFEWDAEPLGGISVASLQAERGAAFPIPAVWGPALQSCTVLVTHFYPVREAVLNAAPRLSMIASLRHGLENVDISLAALRGVRVENNPGRTAEAVSDLAVGAIIDQVRGYARSDRALRRGHWLQPLDVAPFAKDLRRTTIGVVGFGYVGRRVAHKLAAFGSEVLVHDPLLSDDEIRAAGAEPVSLEDLLRRSDVVTVHVRLSEETRHMLGAAQLQLMKASAYLINVARAELVDEMALIVALQTGRLAGAALDVFDDEPLPSAHPLLRLDNVTLTPHIAGSTVNSEETTARNLAARVKAALSRSATISE